MLCSVMQPISYFAAPHPAHWSIWPTYVRRQLCAFSCYFANFQSKRQLFTVSVQSNFDSIFKLLKITLVANSNTNEVEDIDLGQLWAYRSITFCGRMRVRPNTYFIGPLRVHTPNSISIVLAVTNRQTDIHTDRPRYIYVATGRILCYALRCGLKSKNTWHVCWVSDRGLKLLLNRLFIDVFRVYKYIIFSLIPANVL